jgi:hypothetical protein
MVYEEGERDGRKHCMVLVVWFNSEARFVSQWNGLLRKILEQVVMLRLYVSVCGWGEEDKKSSIPEFA